MGAVISNILSSLLIAKKGGFTLVETMFATALLFISVVGALSLIASTANLAGHVRNGYLAANLAQEGIELAQNIRTTNWVQDVAWNSGLADGTYAVDPSASPVALQGALCGTGATQLYLKSVGGVTMYVHDSGGTATIFSRCITLTTVANPDDPGNPQASYILVQSNVSWGGGSVTAEDHLYNWK